MLSAKLAGRIFAKDAQSKAFPYSRLGRRSLNPSAPNQLHNAGYRYLSISITDPAKKWTSHPKEQPLWSTQDKRAENPTSESPNGAGSHAFSLSDSRKLGYHISGNPDGTPIFFFHGCPSSRLEVTDWHEIGRRMNLCLVGIDRPGMGLSTYAPKYSLLDWPNDVRRLAEHLNFDTFRVFGGSGGGPYALACAHGLPDSILKGTGVLAGMGPPESGYAGSTWDRKFAYNVNIYMPDWMLHFVIEQSMGKHARGPDPKKWREIVTKGIIKQLPLKDQECFDPVKFPEERERMIDIMRESFIAGSDGYVLEAKNMLKKWPFDLKDITSKVQIWNGTDDTHTPIHMARWMANRLPNGTLREFPGDSHFTIFFRRQQEILEDLLNM
jgi:pimeloyl-ACP methyl ester carboxylesterase